MYADIARELLGSTGSVSSGSAGTSSANRRMNARTSAAVRSPPVIASAGVRTARRAAVEPSLPFDCDMSIS